MGSHGEHAEQEAALQAAIAQLKWATLSPSKGLADFILPAMHEQYRGGDTSGAQTSPGETAGVILPVAEGLPDAARQLLTTPPRRLCWWIKNTFLSFVMISPWP